MRLLDAVLDGTIVLSFDRAGFTRHSRRFRPEDLRVDLTGRLALVTGPTSGLGRAAALGLARLGAELVLLCRDITRGRALQREIRLATGSRHVSVERLDLAELASVRDFARRFAPARVDVLVHNAGVLPAERQLTPDGLELTWATNVAGPYLLTRLLLPRLKRARQGRVVVVSSGGMYGQRLSLDDLDWQQRPFDGVAAYAQSKRAEVVLTELLAERLRGTRVTVNAMHPGWADTPGVRRSLPRFHRLMKSRLRTPTQGADTIVWLAACPRLAHDSGRFWFDREAVSTHLVPWTREAPAERPALLELLERQTRARRGTRTKAVSA